MTTTPIPLSIERVNFIAENLKIFKKAVLPLFALIVTSNTIDQYLSLHVEQALQSPEGMNNQVYIYGLLSILSSIVFPVLLLTIALFAMIQESSTQNIKTFLRKHLEQIYIETFRAWGKSLLWSLLFILPGLWKYLEFIFVPFVVTTSEKYEHGELDALKASSFVFRRNWPKILGILGLFYLFIPLVLTTFFDSYRLIWKSPLASLALSFLDTYFLLISTQLLFVLFREELSKSNGVL